MMYSPKPIAMAVATYCNDNIQGMLAPNTVDTKPMRRSNATPATAPTIEIVRLWRVVRGGPEIGIGDYDEGNWIQRRHQPIMQLGAELVGLLEIELIIRGRKQELP